MIDLEVAVTTLPRSLVVAVTDRHTQNTHLSPSVWSLGTSMRFNFIIVDRGHDRHNSICLRFRGISRTVIDLG
jgi:hypothetical protein